jgi:hypothetical protein
MEVAGNSFLPGGMYGTDDFIGKKTLVRLAFPHPQSPNTTQYD